MKGQSWDIGKAIRPVFADPVTYWPASGPSLGHIYYSRCSVGVIQHFIKHTISFSDGIEEEHLFCYIHWKQAHPNFDWFGQSAIVSSTLDEVIDAFCYMPIQWIACKHLTCCRFWLHNWNCIYCMPHWNEILFTIYYSAH